MLSWGTKIVWRRAQDYIAFYQSQLIGITGNSWRTLTRDAITVALHHTFRVRQPQYHRSGRVKDLALDILGIEPASRPVPWWSLLTRSLAQELREVEPEIIPLEVIPTKPGTIDWVTKQVPFKIVVVSDIGSHRLDYFESPSHIAQEEQALVTTLPVDGLAILNADEPLIAAMAAHTKAQVITYGRDSSATVRIDRVTRLPAGGLAATLVIEQQHIEVHAPYLVSLAQVSAVAAALAVAWGLKMDLSAVGQQLQALEPGPGYMRRVVGLQQATIIDGSAAATPEAMMAAIEVLRALPARRKIAILGDISTLGREAYAWHKRLGKLAGEVAHIVVGIGEQMRYANIEAILVGADTHHFATSAEASTWVSDYIQPEDVVLVMGGTTMKLQEVVDRLSGSESQ